MNDSTILPSNDLAKIIFFLIIQIASCFIFFWGVIPTILLLIGYYLTRRDKKIDMLAKAIKACKLYVYVTLLIFTLTCSVVIIQDGLDSSGLILTALFFYFIISVFYISLINFLFKNPIEKYSSWIAKKGLFSPMPNNL